MKRLKWKMIAGIIVAGVIALLAYINRHWLLEAFHMVRNADPLLLLVAFGIIIFSFFTTSRIFGIVLRLQGFRMGWTKLWAIAIVSVILSQSVPAGGVWTYAFLVSVFKRNGLSTVQSALAATMDMLGYTVAMLIVVAMSMVYLAFHNLTTEGGSYIAAGFAILFLGCFAFIVTRQKQQLLDWSLAAKNTLARILRQEWSDEPVLHVVNEFAERRHLIASKPHDLMMIVPVQLVVLSGHSLAIMVILLSLGVHTNFMVVLSAFGISLITSTVNILPGGGGTVETAVVAALYQFGVGSAALPAAIIFRMLNFWLMLPIAAICYYWLMHEKSSQKAGAVRMMQDEVEV